MGAGRETTWGESLSIVCQYPEDSDSVHRANILAYNLPKGNSVIISESCQYIFAGIHPNTSAYISGESPLSVYYLPGRLHSPRPPAARRSHSFESRCAGWASSPPVKCCSGGPLSLYGGMGILKGNHQVIFVHRFHLTPILLHGPSGIKCAFPPGLCSRLTMRAQPPGFRPAHRGFAAGRALWGARLRRMAPPAASPLSTHSDRPGNPERSHIASLSQAIRQRWSPAAHS